MAADCRPAEIRSRGAGFTRGCGFAACSVAGRAFAVRLRAPSPKGGLRAVSAGTVRVWRKRWTPILRAGRARCVRGRVRPLSWSAAIPSRGSRHHVLCVRADGDLHDSDASNRKQKLWRIRGAVLSRRSDEVEANAEAEAATVHADHFGLNDRIIVSPLRRNDAVRSGFEVKVTVYEVDPRARM